MPSIPCSEYQILNLISCSKIWIYVCVITTYQGEKDMWTIHLSGHHWENPLETRQYACDSEDPPGGFTDNKAHGWTNSLQVASNHWWPTFGIFFCTLHTCTQTTLPIATSWNDHKRSQYSRTTISLSSCSNATQRLSWQEFWSSDFAEPLGRHSLLEG